ncbi:PglL family O-oligosaccharyltransferase [Hydrogenophaga sp. BPS33]|uniref:PglL family O-oligosaccharyltransferase n=1 Tax=Hydrogenophaga sp. BPS33 TaxID=2651974 RepID=UPI0013201D1A|nr:O-antigen ligase family protein [Hydrogenophaga sp. BPS33]QHE88618.1 hypothetical protein F9K07_28905 [Hydrogenophaga sp. BPS33]
MIRLQDVLLHSWPAGHKFDVSSSRVLLVLVTCLVAAPWFWPFLRVPIAAMWPNMFAWAVGAVLFVALPSMGKRSELALAGGWLCAALGSSVLGLLQYFDLENVFYPWVAPTPPGYVIANVHQMNMLATLLGVGLISLWWMFNKRYLSAPNVAWMAALMLATLAATASRTGLVHLLAITCMFLLWHTEERRRCAIVVLAGWGIYIVAAQGLPWLVWLLQGVSIERQLLDRFGMDLACHSRRVLWSNVVDLILLKPWAGWGSGELMYAHYITDFAGVRFCEKPSHAHNIALQLAVTMGLPVAILAGVGLCALLLRLKPWFVVNATERMYWGILALIGVHSLLEYPLWFGVFQMMFLMCAWQIYRIRRTSSVDHFGEAVFIARTAMASLCLVALAGLTLDYNKVSQIYIPASERSPRYREETYNKVQDAAFFRSPLLIAQVLGTPLDQANAQAMLDASLSLLHVEPDPRIIRRVIDSAALLGFQDLAAFHEARFSAAWPKDFEQWKQER